MHMEGDRTIQQRKGAQGPRQLKGQGCQPQSCWPQSTLLDLATT